MRMGGVCPSCPQAMKKYMGPIWKKRPNPPNAHAWYALGSQMGLPRKCCRGEHLLYSRHEIIVIRQAVLYEHFGTFATE